MQTTLHGFQIKINCNRFRYAAPCQTLDFHVTRILTSEKLYVIKLYSFIDRHSKSNVQN